MEKDFREIIPAGRDALRGVEGNVLYAYDDAVYPTRPVRKGEKIKGTLTIGTGHTGPDVAVGMTITEAESDALLDADLDVVERFIAENVHVELNDNQHAATTMFGFNIGTGALAKSSFLRRLNAGDYEGASKELLKWVNTTINGKKVKSNGLVARRAQEMALFNAPVGTNVIAVTPSGPEAVPVATEIADAPTNWLTGMLGGLFDVFKPKTLDPVTNKPVKTQPISSPFKSGLNWSIIVGFIAMVVGLKTGVPVPDEVKDNIVIIIGATFAVIQWVTSTFFRKQ